jgi:hypothetical protein
MKEEKFSYMDLIYHKRYFDEVYLHFRQSTDPKQDLADLLIRLNFNTTGFFTYLNGVISAEVDQVESLDDKIKILREYAKKYNQQPLKTQIPYQPNLPPLKEQLTKWLKEEVSHYKGLIKNQRKSEKAVANSLAVGEDTQVRINVSISVPQLALLFRLMHDTHLITNKNQSEIFRLLSENFSTPWIHTPSFDSIRSKYYKAEASTKTALKDVLTRMLNQLDTLD